MNLPLQNAKDDSAMQIMKRIRSGDLRMDSDKVFCILVRWRHLVLSSSTLFSFHPA